MYSKKEILTRKMLTIETKRTTLEINHRLKHSHIHKKNVFIKTITCVVVAIDKHVFLFTGCSLCTEIDGHYVLND